MNIRSFVRPIARRWLPKMRRLMLASPTLEELYNTASLVTFQPDEILYKLFSSQDGNLDLKQIENEHIKLVEDLRRRLSETTSLIKEWSLEDNSSYLVYAIVRIMKPHALLETGVANGGSSFFILNAILANGRGTLYSTDIRPDAGRLLNDKEKANWQFEVLDIHRPRNAFQNFLSRIPPLDFFMHDSDHVYDWQKFEYEHVYDKMTTNSIITSDDIDYSYAFVEFTDKIGIKPLLLIGKRKVFGLVKLDSFAHSTGNS